MAVIGDFVVFSFTIQFNYKWKIPIQPKHIQMQLHFLSLVTKRNTIKYDKICLCQRNEKNKRKERKIKNVSVIFFYLFICFCNIKLFVSVCLCMRFH